jgi:YegS/Rv2252/BmrU family lipid kinase
VINESSEGTPEAIKATVIPAADLPRPITLIVNAHSRRGRAEFQTAVKALKAAGMPLLEAHALKNKADMVRLLKREVSNNAGMVIVGGGDGTLSEAASYLVNTSVAMGVLPMGTGNTLARSLGIPLDLYGAAEALVSGHVQEMDVGSANGQIFLNSVTLGFSSEIAHALDKRVKRRLGLLAWPYIGIRVFVKHRPLLLKVVSADTSYHVRTHQLVVANGRYIAGPVTAAPDASLQDHRLDVFVLGGAGKGSLVRTALNLLRGRHVDDHGARYFTTQEVHIESMRAPIPADVDGEICNGTPLDIKMLPRALKLVVPKGYEAASA